MKYHTFFSLLPFISSALASNDDEIAPAILRMDLNRVKIDGDKLVPVQNIQRREVTVVINNGDQGESSDSGSQQNEVDPYFKDTLENDQYFYSTEVSVGTPGQKITLLVDTGSSDTWFMAPNTRGKPGNAQSFDTSQSTSYKPNGTSWTIKYGIGTAKGTWGTDTFTVSGTKLNSLSVGVASQVSQISQGLMGIGRKQAEITNLEGYTYNNLPWQLKQEGLIKRAAYSMYLEDVNQKSGTVLFGGIDSSKFMGELAPLPIMHPKHLGVQLQGISTDGRSTDNVLSKPMTAILDSGTSLSYLPADALNALRTELNANPSFTIGERYYCDCNITSNLILDFGAQKIAIPAYNFLWPIRTQTNGFTAALNFPTNSCYLSIEESQSGQDYILLGDNIMHGMYIAYDLEGERIGLAKLRSTNGPSNLQEFQL